MKPSGNQQGDQLLKQHIKDLKKQFKQKKKLMKKEKQKSQAQENSREQLQNQNQQDIQDLIESQQEVPNQTEQTAQNRDVLLNDPVAENEAEEVAEQQEEVSEQANPQKKIKQDEANQIEVQKKDQSKNIQGLIKQSKIENNEKKQKKQQKKKQLQPKCNLKPQNSNGNNKRQQQQRYLSYQQEEEMRQKQQLRQLKRELYDQQKQQGIDDFKYYYPNAQVDQKYRRMPNSHKSQIQKRIQQLVANSDIDNLIRNIEDMLRNVLAMSQELDISQIHKIDQTLCTSIQIFFVILFFKDMNILFISFCYQIKIKQIQNKFIDFNQRCMIAKKVSYMTVQINGILSFLFILFYMNPSSLPNSKSRKDNKIDQLKPQRGPQSGRSNQLTKNLQKQNKKNQETSSRQNTRFDRLIKDEQKVPRKGQRASIQSDLLQDSIDNQLNPQKVERTSRMEQEKFQGQNLKRGRSTNSKGQKPTKKIKLQEKKQAINLKRGDHNVRVQRQDRAHADQMNLRENRHNGNTRRISGQEKVEITTPLLRMASQNTPQFNIPNDQEQQKHSDSESSSQSSQNQQEQSQDQDQLKHFSQSDYSSQQKYTIHESQLYIEFSENMPNHPHKYLSDMHPNNVIYRKYTQKGIDGIKKRRKISIGHQSFYLCHQKIPIKMDSFVKSNWINLIQINFSSCYLTNLQFKKFVDNYQKYKYIKMLSLSCNKHFTTVTEQMLARFPLLEYINFGEDSKFFCLNLDDKCHLSPQSIQQIKNYKKSHPKVKVIYCQRKLP